MGNRVVSQAIPKVDYKALVTGKAVYTDDLAAKDSLVVKVLRSPYAHALIEDINLTRAELVPDIECILTYKDCPDKRFTMAGQTYPEPSPYDRLILDQRVRFVGDAVAIVAGRTKEAVNKALKLIKVKYEVLEPVLDFHKAKDNPILVHPEENWKSLCPVGADNKRNLCAHDSCEEGDIEAVLANCEYIIDQVYHTKANQQAMMETFRTYTYLDTYGRLNVLSSTQVPFHVRRILANALDIPKSKIRVIKPRIGGGFGAKQSVVSEVYPALVTWKTGKPAKMIFTREESMIASSPRHEMEVHVRLGADKDGIIQGKIDYVKWDMNRSMADVYAGNLSYDYVLGVYDFMERLCSRYPDLLLEGCSGGGGRFDAGMLYYSPQIWCSDNTDAINRTRIQYGTSFFYPVSAMGAHVSAVPNHQTGRVTSFHTRGVTAMAGTFGYELNPALLSDEEKQQIREQIKTYKKYETLINEGTYWRLSDPFTDEIAAWMSVSEEQDHALVSVVRLMAEANQATVYVRLRGLKPDAVYLEEQSGRQYSGAALMHAGIPLPPFTEEYEAYQFAFTELKEAGRLYEKVQKWCDGNAENRVVISIYGGSGSGKTTLATALQQYFLNDGTECYLLSGDDYPHRIPKRNDEERMRVYKEAGEDGLRGYLGTKKEIDFDRINEVLAAFHEGKDSITLRHM